MNWQNTTLIVLLIALAVTVAVGSLARQLLGSVFELDEDTEPVDPPDALRARKKEPLPH